MRNLSRLDPEISKTTFQAVPLFPRKETKFSPEMRAKRHGWSCTATNDIDRAARYEITRSTENVN